LYKISANTLFIGQQLVFVPECHSTNSLASELAAKNSLSEGTVVITSHQTAGRGQRGNTWEAAIAQNLTFSVFLTPTFLSINQQFYLTIATSLSVIDFLKTQSIVNPFIKWPNDIMVQRKKLCGILIENTVQKEAIQQSIIGIGLNVNQNSFTIQTATSLGNVTHKTHDLSETLSFLLEHFERRYLQLRSGKYEVLKHEYLQSLFGLGQLETFVSNNKQFEGIIKGVNENGQLLVLIDGAEALFNLKEISLAG
jgi:BirA family biotin operon repressor/biotin-[acetyl-CoA-carboxylase] ligase